MLPQIYLYTKIKIHVSIIMETEFITYKISHFRTVIIPTFIKSRTKGFSKQELHEFATHKSMQTEEHYAKMAFV